MTDNFALVPFESHQILTIRNADGIFVVMKPIVETLGLQWEAQRQRIQRHPVIRRTLTGAERAMLSGSTIALPRTGDPD